MVAKKSQNSKEPAEVYQAEEISTEDGKTYRSIKISAPKASSGKPKETSDEDEATKALMRGMGFNV